MANQLKHIADVKVGRVKGNSRIYPQLRLPSQYADLAGKLASIYEVSWPEEDIAFIIRFGAKGSVAAFHGAIEPERLGETAGRGVPAEPCRGAMPSAC